jgi:hypothetical protein
MVYNQLDSKNGATGAMSSAQDTAFDLRPILAILW